MKLGARLLLLRTSLPFAWKWWVGGEQHTPMEFWRWWRLAYFIAVLRYESEKTDRREA